MISNYGMNIIFYSILYILIFILRRYICYGFIYIGIIGIRYLLIYSLYGLIWGFCSEVNVLIDNFIGKIRV